MKNSFVVKSMLILALAFFSFSFTSCTISNNKAALNHTTGEISEKVVQLTEGRQTYCTGTVVDFAKRHQDKIILTAAHCVAGKAYITINEAYVATPLKVDTDTDLALLYVWDLPITPVNISEVSINPGDKVMNFACPVGLCQRETKQIFEGYYSGKYDPSRKNIARTGKTYETWAIPSAPGSSGSPIFKNGKLINIVYGAYNSSLATYANITISYNSNEDFREWLRKGLNEASK